MLPTLSSLCLTQILNALVENCGQKVHSTILFLPQLPSLYRRLRSHAGSFADGQLTDALKHLATDSTTDTKVRKKVLAVLASWSRQFRDDRSAAGIAGLYRQVRPAESSRGSEVGRETLAEREREIEKRRRDKEQAKRKVKEKRLKLEEARSRKPSSQISASRRQFNFEQVCFPVALEPRSKLHLVQEKPQVLTAIANASSAANNLANAMTVRCNNFEGIWLVHV
jgi:hypothetical protein